MAYNEFIADRIRTVLDGKKTNYREIKMMGGLCFMVDEKMCLGVIKDDLMARVGPDAFEALLEKPGSRPMDFTKRPMKGYLYVDADGMDSDDDLEMWIQHCLDFNPLAKASKKKK